MSNKTENKSVMLIDAGQTGETRIAVIEKGRLQEVDHENATCRNLKGNIYLAKIIRVEPSLQAAFVDFGGNTHGFLPFSEIHPNYFRIPVSDREKLEAELLTYYQNVPASEDERIEGEAEHVKHPAEEASQTISENQKSEDKRVSEKTASEKAFTPSMIRGRYQIQEVIENRQVILVQVVKEARGNKGAALTTYLSLAGRYSVFMSNNIRGMGGVSRKITDIEDRKRLRTIHESLQIPQGMGVILRTAGTKRTKAEIKRDYESLLKQWEEIRSSTLESVAPSMVYEEANLVKRAIRDLYSKELEEVLVEGKEAYKQAKSFMKALMPSHAKKVKEYKSDSTPLFSQYNVETQMDAIFDAEVKLPSGGSLVIDTTEALVAIDVNSGRSTRERNIRQTALKTNLEAAIEVARQLKLRDLGGLIVIDFIDMAENRHNNEVERKLKAAMSDDRARVQIGRISNFGLLELSRQRLKPSLIENHYTKCEHCQGSGLIRSSASSARMILRTLSELDYKDKGELATVICPQEIAFFILNHRRHLIAKIEAENHFTLMVQSSKDLHGSEFHLEFQVNGRTILEVFEAVSKESDIQKRSKNKRGGKGRQKETREPRADKAETLPASEDQPKQESSRRRRGRRGGRGRGRSGENQSGDNKSTTHAETQTIDAPNNEKPDPIIAVDTTSDVPKKPTRSRRRRSSNKDLSKENAQKEIKTPSSVAVQSPKPVKEQAQAVIREETASTPAAPVVIENVGAANSPKKGWWKNLMKK